MSQIESLLQEERKIYPSKEFQKKAHIGNVEDYEKLYRDSIQNPEVFWSEIAGSFRWSKKWSKVLEWKEPFAKWFVGGETNICVNALDRHVEEGRGDKTAIVFESEKGQVQKISYAELLKRVCQFSELLSRQGIKKGDRVAIYLPLIPEAVISMLACARLGAVHSVIFGGFSAQALVDRIGDAKAKAIITADGGWRRGKVIPLQTTVEEALPKCPSLEKVFVWNWVDPKSKMKDPRALIVQEHLKKDADKFPAENLDSEHPLFILYTSGSTGKPKGVLHTTGGYMVSAALTTEIVFDLHEDDLYWCTADVGWVTGHSYVTYGPLLNAATIFLYEGSPDIPDFDRFWDMIERHKITILYTAPTAIRAFMKWGDEYPKKHSLKSLRLLGSVGEPINPEAWMWYYEKIGGSRCPIVDTWWQTETGTIMISTLPGVHYSQPGSAGVPMFGVEPIIVDNKGNEVKEGGGLLAIKKPWPAMLRTVYGDDERYKTQYWSQVPHCYFTGDGARKDANGYFWIMGRIDDVVNVSGHRLGTMEIESALVSHPAVAEAAVVSRPDAMKGEAVIAFVTLERGKEKSDKLKEELKAQVVKEIGSLARPEEIRFADTLPKTRSGKIMRRLLRSIASGDSKVQDLSTLEDQGVLEKLRAEED